MRARHSLVLTWAILFLTACSTGIKGEQIIGSPGSPAWFMSASIDTQMEYFRKICMGYGFKEDTPDMSRCLQTEARSAKSQARNKMSEAFQNLGKDSMTCRTVGNITKCRED